MSEPAFDDTFVTDGTPIERSAPAHLHAVPSSRDNGSTTDKAPYSERQSQRVYLAMYRSTKSGLTSLVMVDPAHKWERKPQGSESLILFSNLVGTVRHSALAKLKVGNDGKSRDLYGEQVLQVKNLLAERLMQDYDHVDLNNAKLNFAHLKSPLVVTMDDGHKVFINFPAKVKFTARRPKSAHEFDPENPNHSLIEVLIHDDKITTIDTSWNLGNSDAAVELKDFVAQFVKKAVSRPLETCRKEFRGRTLGKPSAQTANTDSKDRIVELGSINLDNPTADDLKKLEKLKAALGLGSGEAEAPAKKPGRQSREDFLASKNRIKQELWESSKLHGKFHGTPLGEIASRDNRLFDYNEADISLRAHNHDRGILANVEHWHTLAIMALHDLDFKNGEVIDIDEVLAYIEEGLAEVDPDRKEIKVGDNYQTRFFSVVAFYTANARELGLDLRFESATVGKIVKGKTASRAGYHFAVTPAMGDSEAIVKLIAQGNYTQK